MKEFNVKVLVNLKTNDGVVPKGTQYTCPFEDLPEDIQLEITSESGTVSHTAIENQPAVIEPKEPKEPKGKKATPKADKPTRPRPRQRG